MSVNITNLTENIKNTGLVSGITFIITHLELYLPYALINASSAVCGFVGKVI